MERASRKMIDDRCVNLNRRLVGTGRGVVAQGRGGKIGLDEYEVEKVGNGYHFGSCIRTIRVGTTGEIAEFLHAMMVGVDMARGES